VTGMPVTSVKPGETASFMSAGTSIHPLGEGPWSSLPSHFSVYEQAARELGHELPLYFSLAAAQIFWQEGEIVEVRLVGADFSGEVEPDGSICGVRWQTPVPPRFTQEDNGELILASADAGRTHMSAVAVSDEEAPGKLAFVVTLDLTENLRISQAIAAQEARGKGATKSAAVYDLRNARNFTFAEAKAPVLGIIDGIAQRNWKPEELQPGSRSKSVRSKANRKECKKLSVCCERVSAWCEKLSVLILVFPRLLTFLGYCRCT